MAPATGRRAPSQPLKNGCLLCGNTAKGPFCGQSCTSKAEKNAPQLIEVPQVHDIFESVSNQFEVSWRHPTDCPNVCRIYKIVEQPSSVSQYEGYKAAVEARGKFITSGRPAGNEKRRWHGTTRQCLLGNNGNTSLCSSGSCSLCGIIRTSYKLDLFGKKTGWGRFGRGIYTSSTSSKSNDYSKNVRASNQKAIILNRVVVGKGYKMTQNSPSLTAAPRGYDSVLGEVSKGSVLNYDELVCYTESAIRPSYLVIYDGPEVEGKSEHEEDEDEDDDDDDDEDEEDEDDDGDDDDDNDEDEDDEDEGVEEEEEEEEEDGAELELGYDSYEYETDEIDEDEDEDEDQDEEDEDEDEEEEEEEEGDDEEDGDDDDDDDDDDGPGYDEESDSDW